VANVTAFNVEPGSGRVTVSWVNPPAATFDYAAITYSASGVPPVTATPSSSPYTITGLENGKKYTITIQAFYTDSTSSGTDEREVTPAQQVSALDISTLVNSVKLPLTGSASGDTAVPFPPFTEFTTVSREWKTEAGAPYSGNFYAGRVYKAVFILKAKPAYTFAGPSPVAFSYTGVPPAGVVPLMTAYDTTEVTITFLPTATVRVMGTITTGGGGGLPGASVQLKKAGVDHLAPVTTAPDGTYAIGGVEAGTYTAVVSKSGYGALPLSEFTVTDGDVTQDATLNTTVTETDLTGIIDAPVASGSAGTTVTLTPAQAAQYSAGSPDWLTVGDQTVTIFEPGTAYKLTLTLTPQSGWTFTGLTASSFTFTGADSVAATINATGTTATVVITFPEVQWTTVDVDDEEDLSPGASVEDRLNWIKINGVPGTNYTVTVTGTVDIGPQILNAAPAPGLNNVCITLTGTGTLRLAAGNGSLVTLMGFNGARVSLVLAGIALEGRSGNNAPLVQVNNLASLTMEDGAAIQDNIISSGSGYAGGVYVAPGGSFTMNGGTISGNTASSSGGGVYVDNAGSFTMNGGTISGNTADGYSGGGFGGGVCAYGAFTMTGGEIRDNTARHAGGIYANAAFTMTGGEIRGNTATMGSGGGIHAYAAFTMTGGEISGNTAADGGGGVYYAGGTYSTFSMSGGEIRGNTAAGGGGGVYVRDGTFTKTGNSVIYGDTDAIHTPGSTENTATAGQGHAVLVSDTRKRNSDAPAGVNISTAQSGTAGGWDSS
jgi:parallel beta-helix repeat protein